MDKSIDHDKVPFVQEFDVDLAKEVLTAYMAADSRKKIAMDFNLTGSQVSSLLRGIQWRVTGAEWYQIISMRQKSAMDHMNLIRTELLEAVNDFLK